MCTRPRSAGAVPTIVLLASVLVFARPSESSTPTNADTAFRQVPLNPPSGGTDYVNGFGHSTWPTRLDSIQIKAIGGTDSILIASTRTQGVKIGLNGSVTYTFPPKTFANRVGAIVTADDWTNPSEGTLPMLIASFTFQDGRIWGTGTLYDVNLGLGYPFLLGYRVRNWSDQVVPGNSAFVATPPNPAVFTLCAEASNGGSGNVYSDLQTFVIPDSLRNTALHTVTFASHTTAFDSTHITSAHGLLMGCVVWPQFVMQNRQGDVVAHQRQDDVTWASDAYGGYVWSDTLVGADSDLDHLGCFAACASMVNKYFGVTSSTPRTLNQYLQTHHGYIMLDVVHPNNEVIGADSTFAFTWTTDTLSVGHSVVVTQADYRTPIAEARIVSASGTGGAAKVTRFLRGGTSANFFGLPGLAFPGVDPTKASLAFSGSLWKLVGVPQGSSLQADSVELALADSLPVLVGVTSPIGTQHWVVCVGRTVSWPTATTPRGTYAIEDPASNEGRLDPTYGNTYNDYFIARRVQAVDHGPELASIQDDDGEEGFAIAAGGPVTLDVRDELGREVAFDAASGGYTSGIPQAIGMHRFQIADVASSTGLPACEVVVIPASTSGSYFVTLDGRGTGRASLTFQTRSDPADIVAVSDAQSVGAGSTAYYRVHYDAAGATSVSIESVTGVAVAQPIPALRLQSNPNPSLGMTTVQLDLPRGGFGDLRVLDLQGRVVATLRRGAFAAGQTRLEWNGRTDSGLNCASGLYFIRAAIDQTVVVSRVVLVR